MPPNPASILDSVKKVSGVGSDDTSFDLDITMFVNGVFSSLQQLGVGPDGGFSISDNTALWTGFTTELTLLGYLRQYVSFKARLAFDPPATSYAIDAMKEQIAELEWRLQLQAEILRDAASSGGGPVFNPHWWDLTGLSDFPPEAVTGDIGIDFDSCDIWYNNARIADAYMWDLTGLSDFPSGSAVGDLGIDMSTGDVFRRTG